MKRALYIFASLPLLLTLSYFGAVTYLRASLPEFSLRLVEADMAARERDRSLPFFGLMTPMAKMDSYSYVPKLEYRQGPPTHYLSKISYWIVGNEKTNENNSKERVEFFGRRTLDDWLVRYSEKVTRAENWSYATFLSASLHYAENKEWPQGIASPFPPLAKLFFLVQAKRVLGNETTDVYIMDQAGIPAFLFQPRFRTSLGETANIWFLRRNMLHEVRLVSEGKFRALHPQEFFRKSFLIETRQDAMAFVANELSDVQLGSNKLEKLSFHELEWPLLLLGAKLSVDPSSIHAFFHFAGLNALLFREQGQKTKDLELVDSLRNNVLVSERYGRDVAPESPQSLEMGRLARAIVKMLE